MEFGEGGHLGAAGLAPGGPEIEDDEFAFVLGDADVGGLLTDQVFGGAGVGGFEAIDFAVVGGRGELEEAFGEGFVDFCDGVAGGLAADGFEVGLLGYWWPREVFSDLRTSLVFGWIQKGWDQASMPGVGV